MAKRSGTSAKAASKEDTVSRLGELIADIDFAMMTTCRKDGQMHSRPMATMNADPEDFNGEIWFFTHADAPKVKEVQRDPRVNLAYADPGGNRYVSVSGRARLVRDKKKVEELWRPQLKAWFPKGKDDPNVALLCVTVEEAEYWDSPSSKMVQLAGFVKAVVTGKPAKGLGENKKVNLRTGRAAAMAPSGASKR